MAERDHVDELEAAVEAIMRDPEARPAVSSGVAALLRIAGDLRGLPRAEFKVRLREALASRARGASQPPALAAHDLAAALRGLPVLAITPDTTEEEASAAVRELAWLGDRLLGVVRFSGLTPWERHPDGDELLHLLDGAIDVTVLTDDGPRHVALRAGSVFVCPQGLWHRQRASSVATLLFATPARTTEVSWAEDPRTL